MQGIKINLQNEYICVVIIWLEMYLCSQEYIYIATSTSTKHQMKLKLEEYKAETEHIKLQWQSTMGYKFMSTLCVQWSACAD